MTDEHEALEEVSGWAFGLRTRGALPSRFFDFMFPGLGDSNDLRHDMTVAYQIVDTLPEGADFWVAEPQNQVTRGRFSAAVGLVNRPCAESSHAQDASSSPTTASPSDRTRQEVGAASTDRRS